ncbi:MAG: zinc-ribbon domain-containing protein [Abditibacteriota bacterium]|nr:zinc-ribbon domain-containing protein [Abditibacteriota bacterium]
MSELILELPVSVSDILTTYLDPGEAPDIALPASGGGALVVTNKRVFIFGEDESGKGTAETAPLTAVAGATAKPQGMGGALTFKLIGAGVLSEVNYPGEYLDNYKEAADFINKAAEENAVKGAAEGICPKCGAIVPDGSAYCPKCGVQIAVICSVCGSPCAPDDLFCHRCGSKVVPFDTRCFRCGMRVARNMAFCPECGAPIGNKCPNCGSRFEAGWKVCPVCGRRPADGVAQPTKFKEAPAAKSSSASPGGESHNAKGMELFNNEDVDGAIAEFALACQADPTNTAYLCNYAVALDEAERYDESEKVYEKVLSIDPEDPCALLNLGYIKNENGDGDTAKAMWRKILEVAPDSDEATDARDALDHAANV